ncbi:MAG: SH3 domain-containing protein [Rhodobacteraceae bacterium]|jgi:uncharacterized protein YraI|nr:SH3 domain-containing protein [Paracoccaceae bacterium]
MFRKFLTAALIVAALPAAALAGNGWTTGGVKFRSGPGTQYNAIATLPKCAAVTTYGSKGGWVEIAWQGQRGWISAKYLAHSNAHCAYGYDY